jgi:hypothetical protein
MVGRAELAQVAQRLTLITGAPEALLTIRRAHVVAVNLVGRRVTRRTARALAAAPVVTAADLWIRKTRVAEALTVDRARGLAIALATRALTSLVAAHTVGAEVRRALVIHDALVAVVLLRVALVDGSVRAVLTVVARDALSVMTTELFTLRAITHMAAAEYVVVIDALSRISNGDIRLDVVKRSGPNSRDIYEISDLLKGTVCGPVVDDSLSLGRPDTREVIQLLKRRHIDVQQT